MRKIFFRLLIVAMILPGLVQAQALPVSAMQRAISGIMQMKFVQRGFASNDPRWGATLATGGAAIGGAVAAAAVVTAAGVTAPAWVTVGATMALGALFTAGINLAVDGVKWLFNSDGSITTTANGTEPSQKGGDTFSVAGNIKGGDAVSTARGWADAYNAGLPAASQLTVFVEGCVDYASGAGSDCTYGYTQPPYGTTHNWHHEFVSKQAGVAYTCDGLTVNGVCNPPKSTAAAPVTMSPTAAAGSIGSGDGAKPVNPVVLAAIADQAWKQAAAQPGYTGLPYDASNPITQADAAAWQAANPAINPTVAQLVAPQPAPSGGTAA